MQYITYSLELGLAGDVADHYNIELYYIYICLAREPLKFH